ncbi:MAG: DUF3662 and FHA domain-containing protein [Nitriliruptorales bacterium]|nr:DUF3662 and FHA domain-containing protein [Nitriliruptorales bacterium]
MPAPTAIPFESSAGPRVGVLQDFERRLEGAVEGFFARTFRSGLQPVELAKALQRYAEDMQHVTADGVVVPNVYRFRLNSRDHERLGTFGDSLDRELATVVTRTAEQHAWQLRGPAHVMIEVSDDVRYGRYELTGRVEEVEEEPDDEPTPTSADAGPRAASSDRSAQLVVGDEAWELVGRRVVIGREAGSDIQVPDSTVSREHAALVKRGTAWWVVDLGSTNGTAVNGVAAAEHPLTGGDTITFGEAEVKFLEG